MSRNLVQTLILIIFCTACLLVLSVSTSPFHRNWWLDSNIFQQIGLGVIDGKTPYTDLFDHKGPILFYIQALGLYLNKKVGIIFFQIISLSFTMFIFRKCLEIYRIHFHSYFFLSLVALLLCLIAFLNEGNLSEEWSLPYIVLPIYFCQKAIEDESYQLSISKLIGIGICFGIICFIRVNNLVPALGFLLYIAGIHLYQKNYKYVITSLGWVLSGVLSVALFWIMVFYFLGGVESVNDMLYGTFSFNWEYIKVYKFDTTLFFKIRSYAPWGIIMGLTVLGLRRKPNLAIPLLLSYTLGLLSIGSTLYRHYFLVLIPLLPATLTMIILLPKRKYQLGIILVTLSFCTLGPISHRIKSIQKGEEKVATLRQEEFCKMVDKLSAQEKDSIWNFNCRNELDLLNAAGIVQCNRIMVPAHLEISEKLTEEEKGKLQQTAPPYIIIDRDFTIPDLEEWAYIQENYSPVDSTHATILDNLVLMKRK